MAEIEFDVFGQTSESFKFGAMCLGRDLSLISHVKEPNEVTEFFSKPLEAVNPIPLNDHEAVNVEDAGFFNARIIIDLAKLPNTVEAIEIIFK